jgi:hypothetical protein
MSKRTVGRTSMGIKVKAPLVLAALGVMAACSAASSEDAGSNSEALFHCPKGQLLDDCQPPPPPCTVANGCLTPPLPYCLDNPACEWAPKTTPGFDPAWTFPPGATDSVQDVSSPGHTSFSDQLVAYGCTAEKYYYPQKSFPPADPTQGPVGSGPLWATSFCPAAFFVANDDDAGTIDSDNAGMIPCDTCSGAAPAGWKVVVWEVTQPPPVRYCGGFPNRCPFGGGECNDDSCVQNGNTGTLVPVSAPPSVP